MELVKLEWHNERRKLKDLIPYEFNPRKLSKRQKKELTESFEKFGYVEVVAINLDGKLLAGNQRCVVMAALGMWEQEIDIRVPNRLMTEEEFKEYNVRSNKNGASWDLIILKEHFSTNMLLDIGFKPQELEFVVNEEKDIKEDNYNVELPVEPISMVGDLFEMNDHRLLIGDSTNFDDIEKLMNGQKARMVFTDPPYGVSYKGSNFEVIENDDLRDDALVELLVGAFKCAYLHTIENPAIYCFYASKTHIEFEQSLNQAGFRIKQQLIWVKGFNLGRSDYHWSHEPCLYAVKEKNCQWFGNRKQRTVVMMEAKDFKKMTKPQLLDFINEAQNNTTTWGIKKDASSKYLHPTQKPIAPNTKANCTPSEGNTEQLSRGRYSTRFI